MYRSLFFFLTLLTAFSCSKNGDTSDAWGNFEATVTTISSEAQGRLLFLNIEEGKQLKAGTLIGIVDTTQLHLQRKQVEASIGTLPKKLRNTLEDLRVLQNQKNNLSRERDRVARLVAKKAAPTKQLDDLNGELIVADQRIQALRTQTTTTNRGILAEQEPMFAQIDIISEQIRRSYVQNPIAGTVLTKLAEPFEMVNPGAPLYRIAKLDTLTLRFYATAIQLQQVKLGSEVEILVDEGADDFQRLKGRVSWISDQAEFTPKTIQTKEDRVNLVYAVKALVPNQQGNIKIGMPAEVNFSSAE